MIRLIVFLIVAAALAWVAVWLANSPGEVVIRWEATDTILPVGIAVAIVAGISAAAIVVYEVWRWMARLPRRVRARRERLLAHLGAYIDAERYPVNDVSREPTPIFVDRRGHRCAVAALLEATGEDALVERIAERQNLARVRALADDPALVDWLAHHGLGAHEAARIQPAYHAHLEADWKPTASLVAGAHVAATETVGAEGVGLAGARLGVRRNVHGSTDSGNSVYGSVAFVAEYTRVAVAQRGGTHHVSLLLQWEPHGNSRDVQWYLLGGPLASLDADDRPGSGFGAQAGAGFSFRRRSVPLLFELVGQGIGQRGYATARIGLQLGVVW